MIHLSVNINKIATLRNSRGGDIPSLTKYTEKIMDCGVQGITVHPREDERHIRNHDVFDISATINEYNRKNNTHIEYNIEGEPSERYLNIILNAKPDQATLVPVTPGEITSDHGFVMENDIHRITPIIREIRKAGIRVSLFTGTEPGDLRLAKEAGADRIELYTGPFAYSYDKNPVEGEKIFERYILCAQEAKKAGLEMNAGHDLDHINLKTFSKLLGLREVSIGHRLISSAVLYGLKETIFLYRKALGQNP